VEQGYDSGALDEPRLRELIDVGRSLVAELDPETIFRRVLEVARELTGARYAALGVLDEERHELERFITYGFDEGTRRAIGRLPRGRGVLGLLIEEPRPLRLANVGEHPRSYGFPPGHPPMTTFLGVPVVIRGHTWGNLYLTDKSGGGEFDVADERSAAVLAEWAAVAVQNSRLYHDVENQRDEMERAIHRLEATTEIARAVGGETDLDRILEIVVKRARALVEARTLLIELRDGEELCVAAIAGEREGGIEAGQVPTEGSAPGKVLEAPLVFRGHPLGALVALDPLGRERFGQEDRQVLDSFAASAATAVATAQSVAEDRIRDSIAAAERERGRWARELHDESLQSMAGLRVLISAARRAGDEETDRMLTQATTQIDHAIAEMRRLIADLRPSTLDALGLGPALEALIERMASTGEIEVDLSLDLAFHSGRRQTRLVGEVEDAVYRLVQEALNNAVRHAHAEQAAVEVLEDEESVRVRVEDRGMGFDLPVSTEGFGLVGMRERVTLAGGSLEVESTPGEGTRILAVLPARHREQPLGAEEDAEGGAEHRAAG
jgi:signal transduction histidine kinase